MTRVSPLLATGVACSDDRALGRATTCSRSEDSTCRCTLSLIAGS